MNSDVSDSGIQRQLGRPKILFLDSHSETTLEPVEIIPTSDGSNLLFVSVDHCPSFIS